MASETDERREGLVVGPRLARMLDVVRAADLPALLVGKHGIGKSEFLHAYAAERGMKPYVLDLSLLEATDLTGIPFLDKGKTRFAPPATLPDGGEGQACMLVLEELNRCDRSVRQPCLQLLTTRHLNDYRLPRSCFLVACLNPAEGGYEVDELDPALASRFVQLRVEADTATWASWARRAGVDERVVRFIERYPQAFDRTPPRTWAYAARVLSAALAQGFEGDDLEAALAPLLSPIAARALVMDIAGEAGPLDADEVLAEPDRFVDRFAAWTAEGKLDVVAAAIDSMRNRITSRRARALGEAITAGLHRILDVVPPDLAMPLLEAIERASDAGSHAA